MQSHWLTTLRLFLLLPVLTLLTANANAQTSAEAAPGPIAKGLEEPQIALPEIPRNSRFRNVSARKTSSDPLVLLCQEAVDVTSRRMLSTEQHTPWQMMHALLGLRQDFQMMHEGQPVNGLEWISQGQVFQNEYWFEETQFGGRAHPYSRPYAFEGHANQFLAILSMCGVPLDQEFGTKSNPVSMRQMVKHAQMTVSEKDEPTWTLWALSRYLPPNARWRNAAGEMWSIERLVQLQCKKPIQRGAPCGGTHALFALAHARNVYQREGKPLRGWWMQAEYKIRQFTNIARMQQNSNGSLSSNFFRGRSYNPDYNKRMASVGHLLEFLMIALPQNELNSRWVRRAIESTAKDLLNNRKAYVKCSPLYHSVDALNIYLDRVNPRVTPTPEQVAEAEKKQEESTRMALKPVPGTSISQSKELPKEEKPETKTDVASTEAQLLPPADLNMSEENDKSEQVATADLLPGTDQADGKPEEWKATPNSRRTPIIPSSEAVPAEVKTALAPVPDQPETSDSSPADATAAETTEDETAEEMDEAAEESPTSQDSEQQKDEESTTESTEAATLPPANDEPVAEETVAEETDATVKMEEEIPPTAVEPSVNDGSSTDSEETKPAEMLRLPTVETDTESTVDEAELPKGIPVTSVSTSKTLETADEPELRVVRITPDELLAVGSAAEFLNPELNVEQWKPVFESEDRAIYRLRDQIVDALNLTEGSTVADVGAGTGAFVGTLSKRVGSSGHVFAIDTAPRFVDHIEILVKTQELQNVDVVRNDARSLMLMRHKVDRLLVCDSYNYFEQPQDMLQSMYNALNPGGEIVLVETERIPGETADSVVARVRADKDTYRQEFVDAGFEFLEEVELPELQPNYLLRFRKPGLQ